MATTADAAEPPATAAKASSPREKGSKPAAAAPPPPSASKKASSSSLLFIVVPLLVALIGGAWTTLGPQLNGNAGVSRELSDANASVKNVSASAVPKHVGMATPTTAAGENVAGVALKNKYESEVVHINTQKLLMPSVKPEVNCPTFAVRGDLTHVETVMGRADELKKENRVFIMLNGQNEGLFFNWSAKDACLHELATFAAESLGTDVDILANGVKLMTQDGFALTTVDELDQLRIAHVLFDFQIWVWPGIKVGHKFTIEGYKIKTASMRPKVFTVEGFFSQGEADSIIEQGVNRLTRSPVDSPDAVDGYHADRTSDTAFLRDNQFTRDFRVRTATLLRLPSPSFVERMQLVRYQKGQFFRKHEDYFDSKQFIPKKALSSKEYEAWTEWAAAKIQELMDAGRQDEIPEAYRPGGAAFPDFNNKLSFQHSLLRAFMEDAEVVDFFVEHADVEWGTWIKENLANNADDIVGPLMKDKGYMLPHMIKSWEKRLGLPELRYKIPKRPLSGVTQYFRWIRWGKERVQDLLDTNPDAVPANFRPEGADYPTYYIRFQNRLAKYILEDNTKEELVEAFSKEWYEWFVTNQKSKDVLIEALRTTAKIFEFVIKSWTKRAGDAFAYKIPVNLHHFEPNRFATVFLYLNDCPEGGETVFPYSKSRLVTGIKREGMDECSEGLAVPPTKLFASMFYSQTPLNEVDPASLHGGCPPHEGVKYMDSDNLYVSLSVDGANSFTWNADADEGANAWDLGEDLKADPHAEDDDDDDE